MRDLRGLHAGVQPAQPAHACPRALIGSLPAASARRALISGLYVTVLGHLLPAACDCAPGQACGLRGRFAVLVHGVLLGGGAAGLQDRAMGLRSVSVRERAAGRCTSSTLRISAPRHLPSRAALACGAGGALRACPPPALSPGALCARRAVVDNWRPRGRINCARRRLRPKLMGVRRCGASSCGRGDA